MNKFQDPTLTYLLRTTSRPALSIDGDEGGGGSGGGGNGAGGGDGASQHDGDGSTSVPDWSKFTASLEALNSGNGALGGKLDELINTVREVSTPQEQIEEPPDLDGLSRQELVAYIVGTVSRAHEGRLEEMLQPIIQAVQNLQVGVTTKDVQGQLAELKSGAKDFDDWKGDMVELARAHPSLNVRQLYNLAKSENPTKAKQLDTKYNPPPPPKPKWGGLTNGAGPTGGTNAGAEKVTGKDATIAALTEVAERHPVLASLLNA